MNRKQLLGAASAAVAAGWGLERSAARRYRSAVASFGSGAYEGPARAAPDRASPPGHVAKARGHGGWDRDLSVPRDVTHHLVECDDGGRIHVIERGRGTPILLVHGVTLTAAIWAYQLRDLAASFRVLAVDQRGHGASVAGTGGYGIARLAADLGCVIEELDLDGCVVAGHSMGGMATAELAVTAPPPFSRVAAIALMATTGGVGYGLPFVGAALSRAVPATGPGLRWAARRGLPVLPPGDASYWAARAAFGVRPRAAHVSVTENMIASMSPAALSGLLRGIVEWDAWGRLGAVERPAVVVSGSRDRLTPPWYARRLAREIPSAKLVSLAGAGHMVMLERRAEVASVLSELAQRSRSERSRRAQENQPSTSTTTLVDPAAS